MTVNFNTQILDPVTDACPVWRKAAHIGGALTSLVTTCALSVIATIVASRFSDVENQKVRYSIYAGAFLVGVTAGHFATAGLVCHLAQSSLSQFALSLTFNSLGSIAGLAIAHRHLQTAHFMA